MKKLLFLGVATIVLLTGCAAQLPPVSDVVAQTPTPGTTSGGIAYFAPKYEVVTQDADKIIIEVKNQNTRVETLNYSSGQKYDFRLSQNGNAVYTWSADKLFIAATSESKVMQGESEVYELDLTDVSVAKGTYELEFWSVAKELEDVQHLKLNVTIK